MLPEAAPPRKSGQPATPSQLPPPQTSLDSLSPALARGEPAGVRLPSASALSTPEGARKSAQAASVPLRRQASGVGAGLPAPSLAPAARERERDRLLTLANVQRMRGQTAEARATLEQTLTLSEGMPPRDIAPTQELLGDMYAVEEDWETACAYYRAAHDLDKTRVSAERKFAALTLRIADSKTEQSLADAMLRGDSIADLMASGALGANRGRRNAGVAMLLSMFLPGFGQIYNGELAKGSIFLGIYGATLLYFAVSPDHEIFVKKFAAMLALSHGRAANAPVSELSVFMGVLLVAVWLYAIVDAPFTASRTPKSEDTGPVIDKTGWEV